MHRRKSRRSLGTVASSVLTGVSFRAAVLVAALSLSTVTNAHVASTDADSGGSNHGDAGSSSTGLCATATDMASLQKGLVDLYFLVDVSGSMQDASTSDSQPSPPIPTRFDAEVRALRQFIGDPSNSGTGVGIGFFPIRTRDRSKACDPASYLKPTVEVSALPDAAPTLLRAIDDQKPIYAGTPTMASLVAGVIHAKQWALTHSSRKTALVYVTDAQPTWCGVNNTVANASLLVKQAFETPPSVSTYVLGVGPSREDLDAIAASGGTNRAYLLDSSSNDLRRFSDAFDQIAGQAHGCTFAVPNTCRGDNFDSEAANVQISEQEPAKPILVPRVLRAEYCAPDGWFFDPGPKRQTVTLCKSTCDTLHRKQGARVRFLSQR